MIYENIIEPHKLHGSGMADTRVTNDELVLVTVKLPVKKNHEKDNKVTFEHSFKGRVRDRMMPTFWVLIEIQSFFSFVVELGAVYYSDVIIPI